MKRDAETAYSLSSGQPVTVLAVACPADTELRRIVGHSRWTLLETSSIKEAAVRLEECPAAVIICQPELPDGTWKDLLDHTLCFRLPALLLVASIHADDGLWMEVLNRGGYNVISKPFDEHELVRLVSVAWLHGRERARLQVQARAG